MIVEVLLDTSMHVHYGFLTLRSAQVEEDEGDDAWRGQVNGLAGAAVPEVLRLRTALHTGDAEVRLELHSDEPALGDEWDEVVEVSFASWVDDLTLSTFEQWEGPLDLPPGTYRVRYCARGEGERLLLQFWPAVATDRIVRQTGPGALAWHRTGVAPALTGDELAARVEELRDNRDAEDDDEPAPEPMYRGTDGVTTAPQARMIASLDLDLARSLSTAEPGTHWEVVCWALDQALTAARLRHVPWVADVMAALYRGEVPPELRDVAVLNSRLPPLPADDADPHDPAAGAVVAQYVAVRLLSDAAVRTDLLDAACRTLWSAGALMPGGPQALLQSARQVFPVSD